MIEPQLERALRDSYGKILAVLLGQGLPLDLAEDAVSEAFQAALQAWPRHGTPDSPEAWLMTVARRRALDARRRESRLEPLPEDPTFQTETPEVETVGDERLRLFYLCTHPAIDRAAQTPLMLQLILGFSAEEIAEVYLTPTATLSQRLVRVKRKIRDAKISPDYPSAENLADRTEAVLDAIYALYARGWEQPASAANLRLAREAQQLAAAVEALLPDAAEASGLNALILFSEARRSARRSPEGRFVPLEDQDPADWDATMLETAEAALHRASHRRRPGRFQWEAAIQSAHISRRKFGTPSWTAILALYDALLFVAPSLSARLGRIATLAQVLGPEGALRELREISGAEAYQPYWALRAHLHSRLGEREAAQLALGRAEALSRDPAVAAFLANSRSTPD